MGKAAEVQTLAELQKEAGQLRRDFEAFRTALRFQQQDGAYQEFAAACAAFLVLPCLRGFWPMSSFDENGNAYDLSGQNRTLTYNGSPVFRYDGLAPYLLTDGSSDYLSRADEAGLDILGTETIVPASIRGMTAGGWFHCYGDGSANYRLYCKGTTGSAQRSWGFAVSSSDPELCYGYVSADGTTGTGWTTVQSVPIPSEEWRFLVLRFEPSTELAAFSNNWKGTNTTGVPASIFNSNQGLGVGAQPDNTYHVHLRASMVFLCSAYLTDRIITSLFHRTRGLFRV